MIAALFDAGSETTWLAVKVSSSKNVLTVGAGVIFMLLRVQQCGGNMPDTLAGA